MTSQHDALYRAICEYPDEDTPRLAFADLIEEEGDGLRAAFIRTQVELARVTEYDPFWVKCRQFHAGVFLAEGMVHTLPKPLPDGFSWAAYRFRRGFPWLLMALGAEALTERGAALFATAPIQALSFDDRGQPDVAELAGCPHLARVRRLEFINSRLDADDLVELGVTPYSAGVTELTFAHDGIRADGLEVLAGSDLFPRLESLKLDQNVIPPALLVDALGAATEPGNLRRLSLPFAELHAPDAATLFDLPALQSLDHLDLRDNPRLGPEGIESLTESGILRGLRVLNLSKTYPGVPGVRALTATSALAGVRSLDLSENRLGPVAARALAETERVRGLRVLSLENNPVGDKGAESLAGSRHLTGLLELDLRDCGVTDAGAIALAESPHLENLLRLDVRSPQSGRPFGDAARAALRERFGGRVSMDNA